ncbi:MAG: type II toxin-antitoxin system VapC family toxin [Acidimicrobiia bacterium]|jgi:predicted nucleic acid-binding protein|nr:type II toxin-antitoxin system VapC family toxin [Acidimicrobiia bacterium]
MIAYFDTSAVLPLIIEEPASEPAGRLWDDASRVVSVRLLYPEARAALAQARRTGRLTSRQLRSAVAELEALDQQLDHVEVTAVLATRAGELAETHALRGYDAVHLAAAEAIADADVVMVAGDQALSAAAGALGLATAQLD